MSYLYLKVTAHEFGSLGDYKFADIISVHDGKWVFSKHKDRDTWETQGGHIAAGETPLEAAKRELFEESGAVSFDIEPLCDYFVRGELNGIEMTAHGQVYFAKIHAFGEIPADSEMEKICLLDSAPDAQTYPEFMREVFPLALARYDVVG